MLEQLRAIGNHKVFRWVFALFLIIPFGLFGIDYYFQAPVGGNTVATVGSVRIGTSEFDNAIRRQAESYRQQFGANFDSAIMENPEMRRGVLDRLVAEKLMLIGAHSAGLRMGDRPLAERIAALPPFHDARGQFSKERYQQVAQQLGLSPQGLDERLREDFLLQDYRDAIAETVIVPKATLDNFIRLSEQTREVSLVFFPPEAQMAKVKVGPERIEAYYNERKAEFTIPEQVRAEYLELSVDTLAAQTPVAPEEVKQFYDANITRWGQKETRKASHILITVAPDASDAQKKAAADKAQALADQVRRKPATFAEVARKESQDPGSAQAGGDLGFFGHGQMVKAFEEAAFAAKKGEIVGPVKSDFGYHVILVTDIRPEKLRSVAEATPEIEAEIKKAGAARRFVEMAESFSNIVYEQPSSLKPASELTKVPVQASGWFSRAAGAPPALANPKVVAELFSDDALKAKRNTSAIEARPGVLVSARVLEHKPAELRPLETVRAEIERRLQREEALKLAEAEGEAKLKEALAGKDAALKWPPVLGVNRQKPGGLFPQVLDQVFRVDPKKLPAYVGVSTPAGYALVRVSKVNEVESIDDAKRAGLGTQLRSAVAAQELEASIVSVRNRVGVTVRQDVLERKDQPAPLPDSSAPQRRGPPGKFGG
jgi:peptidyl-prolyl cis-trans isomerase D